MIIALTSYLSSPTPLNTPILDGQLMIKDYSAMTTAFGYRTPMISDSESCSIIMTTQSQAIMVKTRLWIFSEGIIPGLVSKCTSKTIVSLAQLVLGPKLCDTDHMVTSDNFLSLRNHGTRSPWISLNNYHPHLDSPPF